MSFGAACLIIFVVIIVIAVSGKLAQYLYKTDRMPSGLIKPYERLANSASYTYNKHWTSADDLYNNTIGYEFDNNAQLALNKTLKREEMHEANEIAGNMSAHNAADAMNTAYVLGNLYNYNVPDQAAPIKTNLYMNRALARIITNPAATIETAPGRATAEDVIDRAQDFYERPDAVGGVTVNTRRIGRFDFNRIRGAVRKARVEKAAKKTAATGAILPPKLAAVEHYYNDRSLPSDPQNVHDSELNDEMSNMFKSLVASNIGQHISAGKMSGALASRKHKIATEDGVLAAEIESAIAAMPAGSRERAKQVYDRMMQGAEISSLGTNERQVLLETWKRTHASENEAVAGKVDELKSSIVQSLADGMESRELGRWSEVCVTGRCSRVLGSLTLLDANEKLAAPLKTQAVLRKEVLEHAYKTINEHLASSPTEIAEQYQGFKPVTDQAAVDKLESELHEKIEQNIKKEYSHVSSRVLGPLIKDAQAGI